MGWIVRFIAVALRVFGFVDAAKVYEFDVVGSDCLTMSLPWHYDVLDVYFADDGYDPPPCSGLPDTLDWEVTKGKKKKRELIVCWSVNRPRQIVVELG